MSESADKHMKVAFKVDKRRLGALRRKLHPRLEMLIEEKQGIKVLEDTRQLSHCEVELSAED